MRISFTKLFLAFISLTLTGVSYSHHSVTMLFQMDEVLTLEGTVTEFQMGNPHARIFMNVENEEGELVEWMAEGGSRTVLMHKGWTGEEIQEGDVIQIVGNPSRNGTPTMNWESLTLSDGTEVFVNNGPNYLESLRDRRR